MESTEKNFLKDVATHQMTIIRDESTGKHIRFSRIGENAYWFDLITWPGYLCYTGDMGTFVFSRTTDMFDFFRIRENDWHYNTSGGLSINPGYWSEKLLAIDKGGYEEFDAEKFKKVINEYRVRWIRDGNIKSKDDRRELWEAVDNEVLSYIDEGEHAAMNAVHSFSHMIAGKYFHFADFFEHTLTKKTYHYIWCCYAIAWGIGKYDQLKEETNGN